MLPFVQILARLGRFFDPLVSAKNIYLSRYRHRSILAHIVLLIASIFKDMVRVMVRILKSHKLAGEG